MSTKNEALAIALSKSLGGKPKYMRKAYGGIVEKEDHEDEFQEFDTSGDEDIEHHYMAHGGRVKKFHPTPISPNVLVDAPKPVEPEGYALGGIVHELAKALKKRGYR